MLQTEALFLEKKFHLWAAYYEKDITPKNRGQFVAARFNEKPLKVTNSQI